jgi:hypothetical protein
VKDARTHSVPSACHSARSARELPGASSSAAALQPPLTLPPPPPLPPLSLTPPQPLGPTRAGASPPPPAAASFSLASQMLRCCLHRLLHRVHALRCPSLRDELDRSPQRLPRLLHLALALPLFTLSLLVLLRAAAASRPCVAARGVAPLVAALPSNQCTYPEYAARGSCTSTVV